MVRGRAGGTCLLAHRLVVAKYAPQLNNIERDNVERVWHDLKPHHLANRTFADLDVLKTAIHYAVHARNQQSGAETLDEIPRSA